MFLVSGEYGINHRGGMSTGDQVGVVDMEEFWGRTHLGSVLVDGINPLGRVRLHATSLHENIPAMSGSLGQNPLQLEFSGIGQFMRVWVEVVSAE